ALAAARHDFAEALGAARQALAVNPYNERALALRIDALVELGRYDQALKAARDADERRPGIPVFTRFAYVLELRGDAPGARRVLKQALGSAMGRGDRAYVATELGQLAFRNGEFGQALRWYGQALAADPEYLLALQGRAGALAAQGDGDRAVRELEALV
ncbi:tetratricopeptide repeat protein, partial [Streptomyces sp. T-3]|nr:tetratricopeptide repeat protein [Streptomyces sp. T-3]